jgi:hypothetical protein
MNEADTCRKQVVPLLQAASWDSEPHSIADYLADRNILVDLPKDGIFAAFGDARYKIESGEVVKSREMYFAIYQALAEDERRAGLFRSFPADFFDLVIVDECHRGSARDDSSWRTILEYFEPAFQLGMTATPLRDDNRDTYLYFGYPIYEYSIPTNLLFFDRSGPTQDVWYYEHPLPEGRKNYTKTAPIQFEEFALCQAWWTHREENERAWKVPAAELLANNCNLDRKNPRGKEDIAHLPPEQIGASILEKEQRIAEIMGRIQKLLARSVDS